MLITLKFTVDQAEAFRQGISCPRKLVSVQVNAEEIDTDCRSLIADRMDGTTVCEGAMDDGKVCPKMENIANGVDSKRQPKRITAKAPTLEALIKAVRDDHQRLMNEMAAKEEMVTADEMALKDEVTAQEEKKALADPEFFF